MSGAIFETWVVSEIIKSYYHAGLTPIYYYRDRKWEIDLLIVQDNIIRPLEIKKHGTPRKDAIKHFQVLEKSGLKLGEGGVICLCNDLLPIDQQNWFIPAGLV